MDIQRTENGYASGNLEVNSLPPRQAQTLLCCALGMTEKAAANELNCSQKNISAIKAALFFKLNANSTPDLITKAFTSKVLRMMALIAAVHLALIPQSHCTRLARVKTNLRPARELRIC